MKKYSKLNCKACNLGDKHHRLIYLGIKCGATLEEINSRINRDEITLSRLFRHIKHLNLDREMLDHQVDRVYRERYYKFVLEVDHNFINGKNLSKVKEMTMR